MLITGTAPHNRKHLFQEFVRLPAIAYAVNWMNVLLAMRPSTGDRNAVVKFKNVMRQNITLTDVTPAAISFQNASKVNLFNGYGLFAGMIAACRLCHFQWIGPSPSATTFSNDLRIVLSECGVVEISSLSLFRTSQSFALLLHSMLMISFLIDAYALQALLSVSTIAGTAVSIQTLFVCLVIRMRPLFYAFFARRSATCDSNAFVKSIKRQFLL